MQKQNNKKLKKVDKKELTTLDRFLSIYGEKRLNTKQISDKNIFERDTL
jgi:hypothetical protein